MKIFDVSRPIHEGMLVYPGNAPPRLKFISKRPLDSTNLSEFSMGSHTGTHVDAPKHVAWSGKSVLEIPFDHLHGSCRVLDFTHAKKSVGAAELKASKIKKGEIILLKTRNSEEKKFVRDYVFLELDAALFLAEKKVRTLGVDGPSVQKFHSGNQLVHEALLLKGITVFEGLNLSKVPAGTYDFVGLPLPLQDAEASPARVFLIKK